MDGFSAFRLLSSAFPPCFAVCPGIYSAHGACGERVKPTAVPVDMSRNAGQQPGRPSATMVRKSGFGAVYDGHKMQTVNA